MPIETNENLEFSGSVAVVTGGTRGIGFGITKYFLEKGATVLATYCTNESAAAKAAESLGSLAEKLKVIRCDVSDKASADAFFDYFDGHFSGLQILINNAGIRKDAIAGMLTEEDWDSVLDTNLKGTFLMTKAAIQRMSRARFGRIICITSPSGQMGFQGQGNYAASKAGQVGFVRSVAKEVAKRNITVNCVSPGFIGTDLLQDLSPDLQDKYKKMVPLERFGTVEEVAYAVGVLASTKASYINGTILEVTGGL